MSVYYTIKYGFNFVKTVSLSMSDIIEKVRCYSACCGGQVIVEDHCESEESTDTESEKYSGDDFDIIDSTFYNASQCT